MNEPDTYEVCNGSGHSDRIPIHIMAMPGYLDCQKLIATSTISFAKIRNELNTFRAIIVKKETNKKLLKESLQVVDKLIEDNLDLERDVLAYLLGEFYPAWSVLSPTVHNKKRHYSLEAGEVYPRDMIINSSKEKIIVDIKRWYGIGSHYYLSIKSGKKEYVHEVFTDMGNVEICIEDFIKEHFPGGCEIERKELDDSVKWHYKQGD